MDHLMKLDEKKGGCPEFRKPPCGGCLKRLVAPVYHPFLDGIFPEINYPAIGGTPSYGNPRMKLSTQKPLVFNSHGHPWLRVYSV